MDEVAAAIPGSLASAGFDVAVIGVGAEAVRTAALDVLARGGRTMALEIDSLADVTRQDLGQLITLHLGPPHAWVVASSTSIDQVDGHEVHATDALIPSLRAIVAARDALVAANGGHVVIATSVLALHPAAEAPITSAVAAALRRFSSSLHAAAIETQRPVSFSSVFVDPRLSASKNMRTLVRAVRRGRSGDYVVGVENRVIAFIDRIAPGVSEQYVARIESGHRLRAFCRALRARGAERWGLSCGSTTT